MNFGNYCEKHTLDCGTILFLKAGIMQFRGSLMD